MAAGQAEWKIKWVPAIIGYCQSQEGNMKYCPVKVFLMRKHTIITRRCRERRKACVASLFCPKKHDTPKSLYENFLVSPNSAHHVPVSHLSALLWHIVFTCNPPRLLMLPSFNRLFFVVFFNEVQLPHNHKIHYHLHIKMSHTILQQGVLTHSKMTLWT